MRTKALFMRHGKSRGHSFLLPIGTALLIACGVSGVATAATLCVNPGGTFGCKSTIGAAVAAASAGDTIEVAPGTYKEMVTITKSLSLIAKTSIQPVINATGLPNGIYIDGMKTAPSAGVANVLISGFSIRNADFEGILIANASDVTIANNHVSDNDRSLDIATPVCNNIPKFETNENDDCGEGVHLMAADHSSIIHNEVDHNSGGILISDETGASRDNLIDSNFVHDNVFDCGITLASHAPATSVIPSATVSYGVIRNTIAHNTSSGNGVQVPGAGAGVGMFAPGPGATTTENVVIDNVLTGNGQPGVAMHNHAAPPAPAPGVNLNGNMIVGNHISGNAKDAADAATSGPTGINVYSVAPIYGTVISQNVITDEAIDVAFKAPAGQLNVHLNDFDTQKVGVDNMGTGNVNATDNWWNCAAGPNTKRCASAIGAKIATSPWLTSPFSPEQ